MRWPNVFRTEDLADLLSAEAVAAVAAEVDGRAPQTRARNFDELHELIRAHGSIPLSGVAEHTSLDPSGMLANLKQSGRIVRALLTAGSPEVLISSEDVALFAALYPNLVIARPAGRDQAPPPVADREAALQEIVRRALATSAPGTAPELAERLSLPVAGVKTALGILEAQGAVFRGQFTTRPPARVHNGDLGTSPRPSNGATAMCSSEFIARRWAAYAPRWNHAPTTNSPPSASNGRTLARINWIPAPTASAQFCDS